MLHFYDFEVFANLWTVVIIDPQRRQETVIVNDKEKLEQYYNQYKNEIFVGYNSRQYDQYIFKSILCGFDPKEVNDWIILQDRKGWEFSDLFRNIPFNNYDLFSGYNGLKTLEAFMGNDVRETSIPFDYEGEFTPDMINEVITYNRHDVMQTIEVFKHRINDFNAQVSLLNTFNLPMSYIGKTKAQLAAVILGAKRVDLDDEWNIRLPHTLKLTKYRHIADWFMDPANHRDDASLLVDICGVNHIVALGGLHGAESQYIYVCEPDEVFVMADVDQLYPSLMKHYNLLSRAVHEPERFSTILDTSLRLKAEGKTKEREPYKLICNITYGAEGDRYNAMYDPLHRKLVCIFGQLLIIDLLEKVEPFVQLIQSNTDGILVKLKRKDVDRFKATVKAWEDRTMLHMSYNEYEKVYQGDVNNYIVVDHKGGYKCKGAYVKKLNPLDNDLPIVNRAITDYLVKGIHPRDTIMACDDLMEYQKVVKVSSKYAFGCLDYSKTELVPVVRYPEGGRCRYEWNDSCYGGCEIHGIGVLCSHCNNFTPKNAWLTYERRTYSEKPYIRLNDRIFRVFASTRLEDGSIAKMKDGKDRPEKFANTPEKVFIWNESVRDVKIPPYLDREYYVKLAINRIRDKFGVTI